MSVSLKSIRTFVLVVRAGSFSRAAEWLHVTQGAVSQQMARLEEQLGTALLDREGRRYELTAAGRRLFRAVTDSVDRIDHAVEMLQSREHARQVSLTCLGSFAAQWLVPRLGGLAAQCPELRLRLDTSPGLWDLETLHVDLAIRMGQGRWRGMRAERLFDDRLLVVANRELAGGLASEGGLSALHSQRLLYDLDEPGEWSDWFRAAGVEPAMLSHGFSDTLVLLAAVGAGQGIGLVRESLVAEALASGTLRQPIETTLPAWGSMFLVYPEDRALGADLRRFRDWLHAEAARYRERKAGR